MAEPVKTAPRFAMIGEGEFRRLPSQQQMDLFWDAECYFPCKGSSNRNAEGRWIAVYNAKTAFWNDRDARQGVAKQQGREGLISAAEANEWLRSLPPLPLHGEDGDDMGVRHD